MIRRQEALQAPTLAIQVTQALVVQPDPKAVMLVRLGMADVGAAMVADVTTMTTIDK